MLILVRHGETAVNTQGRLQGRVETTLTDRGREQAERLAAAVATLEPVAVVSSPLRRARETAAAIGDGDRARRRDRRAADRAALRRLGGIPLRRPPRGHVRHVARRPDLHAAGRREPRRPAHACRALHRGAARPRATGRRGEPRLADQGRRHLGARRRRRSDVAHAPERRVDLARRPTPRRRPRPRRLQRDRPPRLAHSASL